MNNRLYFYLIRNAENMALKAVFTVTKPAIHWKLSEKYSLKVSLRKSWSWEYDKLRIQMQIIKMEEGKLSTMVSNSKFWFVKWRNSRWVFLLSSMAASNLRHSFFRKTTSTFGTSFSKDRFFCSNWAHCFRLANVPKLVKWKGKRNPTKTIRPKTKLG